jgi:hypothetical protein
MGYYTYYRHYTYYLRRGRYLIRRNIQRRPQYKCLKRVFDQVCHFIGFPCYYYTFIVQLLFILLLLSIHHKVIMKSLTDTPDGVLSAVSLNWFIDRPGYK